MSTLPHWCHLTWQWDDSFPCTIPWLALTSRLSLFWKASVENSLWKPVRSLRLIWEHSVRNFEWIPFWSKVSFFVQAVAHNRVTWKGGLVPSATKSSNFMLQILLWFVLWWTSFCLSVGVFGLNFLPFSYFKWFFIIIIFKSWLKTGNNLSVSAILQK